MVVAAVMVMVITTVFPILWNLQLTQPFSNKNVFKISNRDTRNSLLFLSDSFAGKYQYGNLLKNANNQYNTPV